MAKHVFKLPDVGEGVVEGEIVKWNVKQCKQYQKYEVGLALINYSKE